MAANPTVQAIPTIAEPAVDRNRNWTPRWYVWLKAILDNMITVQANIVTTNTVTDTLTSSLTAVSSTVNGLTTSVNTLSSVTNGIEARWGVSIDVHGVVNGLIRLDGNASGSTFLVQADKFIVSEPAAPGTTIQAFIVGNVGGVATVGINGNLLVDGSIIARSLNVATLSAITANIGTVTAGVLQSADGKMVIDLNGKSITITT